MGVIHISDHGVMETTAHRVILTFLEPSHFHSFIKDSIASENEAGSKFDGPYSIYIAPSSILWTAATMPMMMIHQSVYRLHRLYVHFY